MKPRLSISSDEDFGITDRVLLLFNEHDTKIALNWEFYTPNPRLELEPG